MDQTTAPGPPETAPPPRPGSGARRRKRGHGRCRVRAAPHGTDRLRAHRPPATGTFGTVPGLTLLYCLTDVLAVPAVVAGAAVFVPRAWDVVINPLVGAAEDRSRRSPDAGEEVAQPPVARAGITAGTSLLPALLSRVALRLLRRHRRESEAGAAVPGAGPDALRARRRKPCTETERN
ncbi:hypothetical protein Shyhy01_24110 [Streptomyces hygroscopicus subsp. hygroscopicus]|nr:hypothetical protein Shyhy01_24110 [Streptomyces hygroscopicus subsp. hygroscopicus]